MHICVWIEQEQMLLFVDFQQWDETSADDLLWVKNQTIRIKVDGLYVSAACPFSRDMLYFMSQYTSGPRERTAFKAPESGDGVREHKALVRSVAGASAVWVWRRRANTLDTQVDENTLWPNYVEKPNLSVWPSIYQGSNPMRGRRGEESG